MKLEWTYEEFTKDFEKNKQECLEATNNFVSKWKGNEDYLKKPEKLKEALDDFENWTKNYSVTNEQAYYDLKKAINSNDTDNLSKLKTAEKFMEGIKEKMLFFEIEISKIPSEEQKIFLENENLKEYRHYLEQNFNSGKYILSEKEEKILDLMGQSAYTSWEDLTDRLLSEEKRTLLEDGTHAKKTYPELFSLMESKNKSVRLSAKKAFNSLLKKHSISIESEMNAILRSNYVYDKLRNFPRPDSGRHLDDDIESEVVDTLIKNVSDRFDISQKYYELKRKVLGFNKLDYTERNMDLGEIKLNYDFDTSVEIVKKVFKNLDEEFEKIFMDFLKNGKIDVFPKKGKDGGAFCTYFTKEKPVYILLNYTNKIDDITTIAHEVGHGINDILMRKQNALNYGTPKSTTEVASTFMEDFVFEELLKNAKGEEKFVLLMKKIEGDIGSIQRQVAFYNFETELHKKYREENYLSNKQIGKLFKNNLSKYLGENVDCKDIDNWWMYIGHFRNPFYVYSYASGVLISKSMQQKVKENPKFINEVKEFLSSGSKKSPRDLFLDLEIDITKEEFWNKGLDNLEGKIIEAENLARELGKI